MKELSIEEKVQRYDEALKVAKDIRSGKAAYIPNGTTVIEAIFPELKESEDEKIRKIISDILLIDSDEIREILDANNVLMQDINAWFEKQTNKDSQATLLTFTFDDVLALQCCMKTVKKAQEDNELYEQLQSLHDRLHDAYWIEKEVPFHLSHADEIMIRQLTEYFTTGKGLQNTNDTVVEWLEDVKRKLEKQSQTFAKKDVDDAYLKGVCDAKHELETLTDDPAETTTDAPEAGQYTFDPAMAAMAASFELDKPRKTSWKDRFVRTIDRLSSWMIYSMTFCFLFGGAGLELSAREIIAYSLMLGLVTGSINNIERVMRELFRKGD